MDQCMMTESELALSELKRAADFYEKVKNGPADERMAVGCDHIDWLIEAALKAAHTN